MPVYNGERFIGEAIESILSQTFTDFELIIVDDGSDDRSAEIIRSFQERDGRIQFIQLEDNMGPATARNCGIFASRGEYVTFMDCDEYQPARAPGETGELPGFPIHKSVRLAYAFSWSIGTCRHVLLKSTCRDGIVSSRSICLLAWDLYMPPSWCGVSF